VCVPSRAWLFALLKLNDLYAGNPPSIYASVMFHANPPIVSKNGPMPLMSSTFRTE
jgi:hypothetical protein